MAREKAAVNRPPPSSRETREDAFEGGTSPLPTRPPTAYPGWKAGWESGPVPRNAPEARSETDYQPFFLCFIVAPFWMHLSVTVREQVG